MKRDDILAILIGYYYKHPNVNITYILYEYSEENVEYVLNVLVWKRIKEVDRINRGDTLNRLLLYTSHSKYNMDMI